MSLAVGAISAAAHTTSKEPLKVDYFCGWLECDVCFLEEAHFILFLREMCTKSSDFRELRAVEGTRRGIAENGLIRWENEDWYKMSD